MLMDNAPIHHGAALEEIARQLNVTLVYLPQQSPFLNPVEQLFNALKRILREEMKDINQ